MPANAPCPKHERHVHLRDERGVALIAALGILLILSMVGIAVVQFSTANARSSEISQTRAAVRHLAAAGEARARAILWAAPEPTDPDAVGSGSFSLEGGTVTFSGTYSAATQTWTLTGTGLLPNPTGAGPLTARVTSEVVVSAGSPTIFVADSSCDGFAFKLNADDVTVVGGIRVNGDFEVNGTNIAAEGTTARGSPCDVDVNGSGIDLGAGSSPAIDSTIHAWPNPWVTSDFTCTHSGMDFKFDANGMTIPSGVYCATGKFEVTGNNITGQITVLADEIVVNDEDITLSPAPEPPYNSNGVLFYATGTKEIVVNGKRFSWAGTIYHPGGRVKFNAEDTASTDGSVEALEVEVNQPGFSLSRAGGGGGGLSNKPLSYR